MTKDVFDIRNVNEKGIYDEIWTEKVYGGVNEGDIVVDIGANLGFYSVFAGKNGASKVLCYEPEPNNFIRLKDHIRANNLERVVIPYNYAVAGDGIGRRLYLHPYNVGGHTLTRDMGTGHVDVPSITLDEIAQTVERIDILKMDCESGEHEIFSHASEETMRKIKRFVMEFHPLFPLEDFRKYIDPYFDLTIKPNHWDGSLPYIWGTQKP